jgi:acetaldehyde dehydrogenase/alcohol dehydrogenase
MADAATMAGLAFANAFLGVGHALAHAVGARFPVPHGRLTGIFLPHVLRYNAAVPTKFAPAPGYVAYVAPERYARLGALLGLGGADAAERRERFFEHVERVLADVGTPRTVAEAGVDSAAYDALRPELVRLAFADPSLRTNPRMPLLVELEGLLRAGGGR